jgi:LysM repeat protein
MAARRFATVLILIIVMLPLAPSAAQDGTTHTVQPGENLFRIALRYNTTVEALAAANGIFDPASIYAGQVLVIPGVVPAVPAPSVDLSIPTDPVVPADPAAVAQAAEPVQAAVYHTVQPGETLASISRAYGVNWTDIATANGIANANTIYSGQQLLIPGTSAPGTAAVAPPLAEAAPVESVEVVPAGTERTHTVQAGEHLAAIARTYGLSWPTIAQANNITDPNQIYAGQVLIIPAADIGQGLYLQPENFAPAAAAPTISTGKQIVVDLSEQRVYAYENGQLVRNVLVSTGLWGTPTVQGDYRIYVKYTSQTMSGPGYYLPGVPFVMYFYQGYSLHGTYWHNNFGQPMSHGCVNMPTPEAEWFFNWSEIGTPVHVEY